MPVAALDTQAFYGNSGRKMGRKPLFFLLLFLYPVLPANYYVGTFSYANLSALLIVLGFVMFQVSRFDGAVFRFNLAFWQFLIVYGIFIFATGSFASGLAWLASRVLVPMVIIFTIRTRQDLNLAIDLMILSSALLGLLAIIEAISGTYLLQGAVLSNTLGFQAERYNVLRSSTTFVHPIGFGLYEAMVAVLTSYRIFSGVPRGRRAWYVVAYVLAAIAVLLSVSRLAIGLLVIAQTLVLLRVGPGKLFRTIIYAVVLGGLAQIFFWGSEPLDFAALASDAWNSVAALFGLRSAAASSSAIGFGNRVDLYAWVLAAMNGNYLWGMGVTAVFSYQMTEWFAKTSIEVHYLDIFYQCGAVGLASLVISYVGTFVFFWRRRDFRILEGTRLPFLFVLSVLLLTYYLSMFGVNETDTSRIYVELVALGIAYVRMCASQAVLSADGDPGTSDEAIARA